MSAYTAFDGTFTRIPGGDFYISSKDLSWDVGTAGSGLPVTVPAAYAHDVSVPWILTWAVSRHDPRFQRAARLHDWVLDRGWTAWSSAAVFHDALRADGVPRARRWAMATSVLIHIASRTDPVDALLSKKG